MSRRSLWLALVALLGCVWSLHSADLKPPLDAPEGFEHDKWGTEPEDIVRTITAFKVSFDSGDDDDGDEEADVWGIPHWVAYEMKALPAAQGGGPPRPDWMTDAVLHESRIAPADGTYHFSNEFREEHPNSKFLGYDRGHMCMKQHGFRISPEADWNTHTLLNVCPQRAELNQGIWLGQAQLGEVMVAIPDAFFKVVVREDDDGDGTPEVLAFIYPQRGVGYKKQSGKKFDHTPFLTNVRAIEHFTGNKFFCALDEEVQNKFERATAKELWPDE